MVKEGEGGIYEVHIRCPKDDCVGNIILEGIKDGKAYYKCAICEKEFIHINDNKYKEVK